MLACAVAAADERPVVVGDRVRITAPSLVPKRAEGTLAAVDPNTFTVISKDDGRTIEVPRSEVTKLEVVRGRKSHAKTGALVGIAWGVAFGIVLSNPPAEATHFQVDGGALLAGIVVGVAMGASIGAVIHTDRWKTMPANAVAVVAPAPGGGVAVALRFSF
jgi:hypothetical protein